MIKKEKYNSTSFKFIGLLLMAFLLLGITSCNRKGCTDPKANNYNDKSTKDDNSCTFDNANFIGSYQMSEDCGGSFTYPLVISEQTDASYVLIENLGGWIDEVNIPALVDGTTLSFDEISNGVRFVGTGSVDTETNVLSLNYQSFNSDDEEISSCSSISV